MPDHGRTTTALGTKGLQGAPKSNSGGRLLKIGKQRAKNSDPVLHNIHAWELMDEGGRTLFNLGQPPEREVIIQALRPRRGSRIRLECDAHDFMQGWIYAADSPYAVATNEDGSFRIDGIPPGEYTITAWHPFLGVREQVVELEPGGEGEVTFDFTGSQVP